MKKALPYILIIALLLIGYYFYSDFKKSDEDYKFKIFDLEQKYLFKQDSINAINDSLTALKDKSIVIAEEAVKAKEIAKNEARVYRNEYNKLVNEIPANQKDSLGNYINRDNVNKKIIAKQDEAIKECETANVAYVKAISEQDLIDKNKDKIIENNNKTFAELKLVALDYGKEQYKKGRNKGHKEAGGVGLIAVILAILFI